MKDRKIKILMTTDPIGGVWTYTLDLCRHLQEYRTEIHLAVLGASLTNAQRAQAEALPNVTVHEGGYKLEWMENPWDEVDETAEWLHNLCDVLSPDLLQFNNFVKPKGDWSCPVITVFHSCVLTWWRGVKGVEAPEEWKPYQQHVQAALQTSDLVIAPTRSMLQDAKQVYGQFENGTYIYNGRCNESVEADFCRPFIFSSGRIWDEAKNLKVLEDVAKEISWPIYVAGSAVNPEVGEKHIPTNVHFLGKLSPSAMRVWMSRASIYIMPSLYEPFGLSVLEAAQGKCALMLSNIKSFRELWGGSAHFFDPRDPDDIIKKLRQVMENPWLRYQLSSAAQNQAHHFCASTMGKSYYEVYQQLVKVPSIITPSSIKKPKTTTLSL